MVSTQDKLLATLPIPIRDYFLADTPTKDNADRLVVWCKKFVRNYSASDLIYRIAFGKYVNDRIGPPFLRQRRDAQVMAKLAHEFGVSRSELARMRWLAHRFPTVEALTAAHPEVTSWTKARVLLTELSRGKIAATTSSVGYTPDHAECDCQCTHWREFCSCGL